MECKLGHVCTSDCRRSGCWCEENHPCNHPEELDQELFEEQEKADREANDYMLEVLLTK